MKSNPCVDVCIAELEKSGVSYRVDWTSRHVHIHFGPEHQHLHVCAATPSDVRAPLNERAQIRRELRQHGYLDVEQEPDRDLVPVVLADGAPRCFSQDIAATFGKAHKDVLRAIDRVRDECGPEFDRRNFAPIEYVDGKGRAHRAYRMTRDGFSLIVMGFTGAQATAWKVRFIDAFNAMEDELSRLSAPSVDLLPIRKEMDAIVSMIGDVEARLPSVRVNSPAPYWAALSRPERRKLERRMRRRAAA